MWKNLSLRSRLCLLLCSMLALALSTAAVAFVIFARVQLVEENAPGIQLVRQMSNALEAGLANPANPQETLIEFVTSLNSDGPGTEFVKFVASPAVGTQLVQSARS